MLFLPADVARLVLDYLGSEGYEKSCETFLLECNHVTAICDYITQNDADIKDLLPLTDKSLNTILHEYSVNKLALKKQQKHQRQISNESELNAEAFLRPFQPTSQSCVAMRRLQQLRLQQAEDARAATLKRQTPIVPLQVTKSYSDIPPGAVVVDPPEIQRRPRRTTKGQSRKKSKPANVCEYASTECVPTSSSSHVGRVVKHPSEFSSTRTLSYSVENTSSRAKPDVHPETIRPQSAASHDRPAANQNCQPAANHLAELVTGHSAQQSVNEYTGEADPMEFSDEAEPMTYTTSPPNQTPPANELKQGTTEHRPTKPTEDNPNEESAKSVIEKENDLKVKTRDDSTFTLADDDIKEFPILLEKLLNDSNLQQKLAENINKALPSENNQPNFSTPLKTSDPPEVESRKIFTDSFLDAHLSEDTIQDIVDMTSIDPAFEGLFNLFNVSKQDFLQENLQHKDKFTSEDEPSFENEGRSVQNRSPTKPSFLFNECSNSAMIPVSPERPSTSAFLDKPQSEESNDVPDNTGHRRKSRKPAKKDVLEPSSIMIMTSVTPKKVDTCARTSPYTSRKTNNAAAKTAVESIKPVAVNANSPHNSSASSVCVTSEGSSTVPSHPIEKQISGCLEPKKISQETVELRAISQPIDTNQASCTQKQSVQENAMAIPATTTTTKDMCKDITHTVGNTDVNETQNLSLKCFETFPEYSPAAYVDTVFVPKPDATTIPSAFAESTGVLAYNEAQSEDECSADALPISNIPEEDAKGDEGRTTTLVDVDLPSEEADGATSVSIVANILAVAMQESRSPMKTNQGNSKSRPSPRKTKQLTPTQDVSSTQEDNLLASTNQTTVSSTSGCDYDVKPSYMESEPVQPCVYDYDLQAVAEPQPLPSIPDLPIINISHKSEPSQIIYSCPVQPLNNSVIRPKSVIHPSNITGNASTNDARCLMEQKKKRKQRFFTQASQRPIKPAGFQLPSFNPVINIPCLIDPLLLGPAGQLSAPIPVTIVPDDGDSGSLDANIFSKLSNLPIIPLSQPVDSSHARRSVPGNRPKTGVNVVSAWQCDNATQPRIISSVGSKSELITALRVNGNQITTSSTKVSKPAKKSNRGKRRIRPIPVISEQLPQNTAFTSAVEVPSVEKENTKQLQTIDLMDLHAIQTASPQKCVNIRQTPVRVVMRRSADGVTSLEEITADTFQSPPDLGTPLQVSQESASKRRVRKQDLSSQSHIRILDFEEEATKSKPKEKSPKGIKSTKKVETKKQTHSKAIKKSSPKGERTVVNKNSGITQQVFIKTNTPKKDLPLKKRPLADSTCELLIETPTKLNSAVAVESPPKADSGVRRSPRGTTPTKRAESPRREKLTKTKSPIKKKLTKTKSPRKEKLTKAKSPIKEKLIKTKSPIKEKLTKTKSPRKEKLTKTKSQIKEKLTKAKSPIKEKLTKTKSPIKEKLTKTKSPRKEKLTKTKSPIKEKLTKTKSQIKEKLTKTKSPRKEKLTKAKSPRKPKVTQSADEIQREQIQKESPAKCERKIKRPPVIKEKERKRSPARMEKTLKSSLKQTENAQEVKRVSFGEVDCITLNSPEVSHNIDQEVNAAAQLLMDMAASSSHPQEAVGNMTTSEMTHEIQTPATSPRTHFAGYKEASTDLTNKPDRKRKRDRNAEKSKESTKKRKGFPKDMDVDKFLSRLQYCD